MNSTYKQINFTPLSGQPVLKTKTVKSNEGLEYDIDAKNEYGSLIKFVCAKMNVPELMHLPLFKTLERKYENIKTGTMTHTDLLDLFKDHCSFAEIASATLEAQKVRLIDS